MSTVKTNIEQDLQRKLVQLTQYLNHCPAALALERMEELPIYESYRSELLSPILDLGCGDGFFAKLLFASQKIEYGIDINGEEIERARVQNLYNELICGSAECTHLPDASIQTVISNSVLEHIEPLPGVLKEVHRILKSDGKLIVTLPTDQFERNSVIASTLRYLRMESLAIRFEKFYNGFWQHHRAMSVSQWKQFFFNHGFESIDSVNYGDFTVCRARDFLVPFAFSSFVSMKALKRWYFFPGLRKFIAPILASLFIGLTRSSDSNVDQGLVFMVLRKTNR